MAANRDPMEDVHEEEENLPASKRAGRWVWDLLKTWGPALLTVLVIRSVVAEPFRIPSGSMVPTLEIGDYILVNKFSYGVRVPFTHIKVVPIGQPQRGDIIVFEFPEDPSLDYIKRIVGVAGDEIQVKDNVLYVNGERQEKTFQTRYDFVDDNCANESAKEYLENLDGVAHRILNAPMAIPMSDYGPDVVPPDSVFVMGDNRDNSYDSRRWGPVPMQNIKGRAIVVWLSYDHCAGKGLGPLHLGRLRLDRFGTVLH